jgi:hypothetical protein
MITVDFDQLDLPPAAMLDLGCGFRTSRVRGDAARAWSRATSGSRC